LWELTVTALIPYLVLRSIAYYVLAHVIGRTGKLRLHIIILAMDLIVLPAFGWAPWT